MSAGLRAAIILLTLALRAIMMARREFMFLATAVSPDAPAWTYTDDFLPNQ
jgi:hypothetical protein